MGYPGTYLVPWVWRYPHWLMKVQVLKRRCSSATSTLESLPLGASCSCISQLQSPSSAFQPGMTLVRPPQGQYWCGLINIKGSLWSSGLIFLGYRTSFLFEPQYGKASHSDLKTSSDGKIYHNFCKFFQWLIIVTARNKKKMHLVFSLHLFSFSFQAIWGKHL